MLLGPLSPHNMALSLGETQHCYEMILVEMVIYVACLDRWMLCPLAVVLMLSILCLRAAALMMDHPCVCDPHPPFPAFTPLAVLGQLSPF